MLSHPPKWRFLPKSSAMNFRPSMGDDAWVPTLSFSLLVFRIHSKAGSSGAHEDNETEGSNLGSAETVPGEIFNIQVGEMWGFPTKITGWMFFSQFLLIQICKFLVYLWVAPSICLKNLAGILRPWVTTCLVANLKENSEKQTTAVHLRIPVLWWIMSLILRIVSNILKDLAYDGSSFQDKPYKVCKSSSIFNPMAFTRTQPLLIIQLPLLGLSSMAAVQAWRSRVPQSTN